MSKIVKIWGGPGIGKSVCALRVSGELSIQIGPRESVEYVGEYAKQLVWQEQYSMLDHQPTVTKGQIALLAPLGKCDFVVTDSPLELGLIYGKKSYLNEVEKLIAEHKKNNPVQELNILLTRDRKDFQKEGRVHTLQESIVVDCEIVKMFHKQNIPYTQVSNTISPSDLCRIILQHYE